MARSRRRAAAGHQTRSGGEFERCAALQQSLDDSQSGTRRVKRVPRAFAEQARLEQRRPPGWNNFLDVPVA